jgi:hypothetical protein
LLQLPEEGPTILRIAESHALDRKPLARREASQHVNLPHASFTQEALNQELA